jgi:RNA polymerase primary sigma factor
MNAGNNKCFSLSQRLRRQAGTQVRASGRNVFSRLGRGRVLTAGEESALAARIAAGDPVARDRLIRANLGLVVSMARAFVGHRVEIEDLIEEGILGLIRAVEGFDPRIGTRFSTYAVFWIRDAMRRVVKHSPRPIHLPSYLQDLLQRWRRTETALCNELQRVPSEAEVARAMGLAKRKLRLLRRALMLEKPSAETGVDPRSLEYLVPDPRHQSPEVSVSERDEIGKALSRLQTLEHHEAMIVRLHFGLGGGERMTLQQIGERLQMSRERVRQIERQALDRIREDLER